MLMNWYFQHCKKYFKIMPPPSSASDALCKVFCLQSCQHFLSHKKGCLLCCGIRKKNSPSSLFYPFAVRGHFIQRTLYTDANILNGIQLVHESFSLRVLRERKRQSSTDRQKDRKREFRHMDVIYVMLYKN